MKGKKKQECILIFSAYVPPHVGGIERYVSNLSKQFVKMGYKPIVVTSNYNNESDFEVIDNVSIIRLPVYKIFKNRYPIVKLNKKERELMRILDEYNIKACIVNTRFHLTSLVGVRYANKCGISVYLIEHGSDYVTLDNWFLDFLANRYEDMLAFYLKRKVNGFYGVSNACGKWLEHFGIDASGTWYNSIDFKENMLPKVKHTGVNFLYAGRIIKQKGVYNILVSFTNLALKYDNINLYIAGDGADLESYKNSFLNDKIHFLGKLDYDELLEYYAKCDVFLYPTDYPEGLPTSILEAGMMKCAVIATARGGVKEIITDNVNGFVISTEVEALEKAMDKLILDEKLRNRFASNLYVTVKNNFSWDVTAKKIIKDINLD